MKYIPVFGDQLLFNDVSDKAVIVIKNNNSKYVITENESSDCFHLSLCQPDTYIAMRRIIKEPKRWTWGDKKEGRLPEVGAELIHKTKGICYFVGVGLVENVCWALKLQSGLIYIAEKSWCSPIETPAEKAKRLEDEWINKAWSETAVFAGVTQDEHDILRIHLRHIYRAQLSGELPMPKKGGE